MKLFKAGDKGKAVCETCEDRVGTTFAYRNVPFSDSPDVVKDLLVAVCDECASVVSIPAQSTPAIQAVREIATESIEVRLPAPYVEALDLAAYRIDPRATAAFRKRLLAYYIHRAAASEDAPTKIRALTEKTPARFAAKGPTRRLSFKVTPRLEGEIDRITRAASLKRTDLIKGLVMQIDRDIVQPRRPRHLAELRRLAAVAVG